eukprot:CAMPEP_0183433862 /NCGR_PEP_ID=MMETSP0370-20130417/61667_1 /TAXON_ID=268820 /ORGANISM="Peridinium aciculiferum, Strain PAER-2" /LENGTH=69 /DNA_ID=CAMNT_0025620313 /DNA_START=78 /DNA_END=287 /DNA_ORIENTATION=+
MAGDGDKQVTAEVIAQHQKELDACLAEVEDSSKKAKEAASQALEVAEKCRQIEDETKKMIEQFNAGENK